MKVKALVAMCFDDFTNCSKGHTIDLDKKRAKELEEAGLVQIIKEEKKPKEKKKKDEVVKKDVEVKEDGK